MTTEAETKNPSDHVIICGLGNVGYRVACMLARLGQHGTIIAREVRKDWEAAVKPHFSVIVGDAREDEFLCQAGVQRAAGDPGGHQRRPGERVDCPGCPATEPQDHCHGPNFRPETGRPPGTNAQYPSGHVGLGVGRARVRGGRVGRHDSRGLRDGGCAGRHALDHREPRTSFTPRGWPS